MYSIFPDPVLITHMSPQFSPHLIFFPTLPSPVPVVLSVPHSSCFLTCLLSTLSLLAILPFSNSLHRLISPAPLLATLYQIRIPTSPRISRCSLHYTLYRIQIAPSTLGPPDYPQRGPNTQYNKHTVEDSWRAH